MKTSAYNTLSLLLAICLLVSCKEFKKSIDETLHPKPSQKRAAAGNDTSSSSVTYSSSSATFSSSAVLSSVGEQDYTSIFASAATLDSIQQLLRDMPGLKGKKLLMLNGIYFYDYRGGMISVDLQDPDKPENVDTYTYSNGEWQMKKPVKIAGNGHFPLELLLMPLDEVKFSTAKKVYDTAVEKSKTVEGAEPSPHVYFNQLKAVHVKEWYVMIRGDRHDYRITFDVNGNFRAMK
jgi:hypothetical protein